MNLALYEVITQSAKSVAVGANHQSELLPAYIVPKYSLPLTLTRNSAKKRVHLHTIIIELEKGALPKHTK